MFVWLLEIYIRETFTITSINGVIFLDCFSTSLIYSVRIFGGSAYNLGKEEFYNTRTPLACYIHPRMRFSPYSRDHSALCDSQIR
ncbi:hypothetical protein MKX01_008523 [Papaver californicum]|nr:hypothetical protein MKX01_008523 [Papaver californicum]